jgi:histidine phosphotransfer protein HptB
VIDWNRIDELHGDVGAADFDEVMGLFLSEVEAALGHLGDAADAAALAGSLHFLKGSALNVGFSALARLCADGEQRALGGRPGGNDIASIRQCYAASTDEFENGVKGRFAAQGGRI